MLNLLVFAAIGLLAGGKRAAYCTPGGDRYESWEPC